MSTELPTSLRDGRYVVLGLIAEGSQGATLDAVDKRLGRPVAVKRFQVKGARSWKDVELAEREASVLSRLQHPLLPAYLDHFEEDGALYLVMEKIEGQSLASLQAERGTLARSEIVAFLHDAADVLGYLHGLDPPVIHRDIKPGNVIRRPNGSFVLVDFGSVRARLAPKGGSTVVGTFGYMAPEQLQGRAMPATDLYGVGATAITLLTGVEPEDLPHQGLAIDVAEALGAHADRALVAALSAMLAPDPDERASGLAPLLAELPRAPRAAERSEPRPAPSAEPPPTPSGAPATSRRSARAAEPPNPTADMENGALSHRSYSSPWSVPAIAGFLVVLVLTLLRVGVVLALRVTVPVVLVLLSILFGRSMIRAAADVRQAGRRAGRRLKQWQGSLRNPPPRGEPEAATVEPTARTGESPAARASSSAPASRPRSRVRFEAPSAADRAGPRPHARRGGHGPAVPPGAGRGADRAGRAGSPVAGRGAEPDLREAIHEIEDAVAEIDREVRRRAK